MNAIRLVEIERDGQTKEPLAIPLTGRQACSATSELYKNVGFDPPWIGYMAVTDSGAIGMCGFKSPPKAGRVEIAYFTFPEFEGRGVATAMARELVSIARKSGAGMIITAQTLPKDNASTRILRKIGFRFAGELAHPEDGRIWEWHLDPSGSLTHG